MIASGCKKREGSFIQGTSSAILALGAAARAGIGNAAPLQSICMLSSNLFSDPRERSEACAFGEFEFLVHLFLGPRTPRGRVDLSAVGVGRCSSNIVGKNGVLATKGCKHFLHFLGVVDDKWLKKGEERNEENSDTLLGISVSARL